MTTILTKEQSEEILNTLNNITKTTKESSQTISNSMKEIMSKYLKQNPPIKVKYKNWQGKIGIRTIIPLTVQYGNTEFHKDNQWLMDVWDVDKQTPRTYAIMDIIEFIKE